MNIELGELKIDKAGNISLTLAGANAPYVVFPASEREKTLFEDLEVQLFALIKTQFKING